MMDDTSVCHLVHILRDWNEKCSRKFKVIICLRSLLDGNLMDNIWDMVKTDTRVHDSLQQSKNYSWLSRQRPCQVDLLFFSKLDKGLYDT